MHNIRTLKPANLNGIQWLLLLLITPLLLQPWQANNVCHALWPLQVHSLKLLSETWNQRSSTSWCNTNLILNILHCGTHRVWVLETWCLVSVSLALRWLELKLSSLIQRHYERRDRPIKASWKETFITPEMAVVWHITHLFPPKNP